jgi:hypothetical protein
MKLHTKLWNWLPCFITGSKKQTTGILAQKNFRRRKTVMTKILRTKAAPKGTGSLSFGLSLHRYIHVKESGASITYSRSDVATDLPDNSFFQLKIVILTLITYSRSNVATESSSHYFRTQRKLLPEQFSDIYFNQTSTPATQIKLYIHKSGSVSVHLTTFPLTTFHVRWIDVCSTYKNIAICRLSPRNFTPLQASNPSSSAVKDPFQIILKKVKLSIKAILVLKIYVLFKVSKNDLKKYQESTLSLKIPHWKNWLASYSFSFLALGI